MSNRKPISNSVRFEVFKRDSFTCQYCGGKAPSVVLNVDHIRPVSDGGTNDILNLVTSCFTCNNGKSDRKLTDGAAVDAARNQAEAMEERRQQICMMAEWQVELARLDPEMEAVAAVLNIHKLELNDDGRRHARQIVRRYGLQTTLAAVAAACDQSGKPTWGYIAAIAKNKSSDASDPKRGQLFRVFNAIVSGFDRSNLYFVCKDIVADWHADGFDALRLLRSAQGDATGWSRFHKALALIDSEVRGNG